MRREIYTHKFFNLKGLFPHLHPQLLQKKNQSLIYSSGALVYLRVFYVAPKKV